MTKPIYFRADFNKLKKGDPVPQGDHKDSSNEHIQLAEEFLRSYHDIGAKRANSIFVFEERKQAENYWRFDKGRHLYSVTVSEIIHTGDLSWLDKIGAAIKRGDDPKEMADKWLQGELTDDPRVEVLVGSAVVEEVLADAAASPAANRHKIAAEKFKDADESDYAFNQDTKDIKDSEGTE